MPPKKKKGREEKKLAAPDSEFKMKDLKTLAGFKPNAMLSKPLKTAHDHSPLGATVSDDWPVEIKRSPIGGKGCFATDAIDAKTVLGEYRGRLIKDSVAERRRNNNHYMFDVKVTAAGRTAYGQSRLGFSVAYVIDGQQEAKSSWARYINAATTAAKQNVKFTQRYGRIWLIATRNIKKGEELLSWYGRSTIKMISE